MTQKIPTRQELIKNEPLLDWSPWQKYRQTVSRPSLTFKADDLKRAHANIAQHDWAKKYLAELTENTDHWVKQLTPQFIHQMIPETTPGASLFTPCPACRDQGKPYLPHGSFTWVVQKPEELHCTACNTVFPNEQYPENMALHSQWGRPQTHTYYGGEPFPVFGYATGRPSFSGNIRVRKVYWMAHMAKRLGEAFALTGSIEYALAVKRILLRFAEVYPYWLVHAAYGEIADMDPHVAAIGINHLPIPELVLPPNKPKHDLFTGYWSAGRAGAVGMESVFVNFVVDAYDNTCASRDGDHPVYSDEERIKIERDLLLESTVLLVADKQLNNKSVGNASAAGLVGMAVGHPGLVRFGYDVFLKTVDGWFLADGTTSESHGYTNMTLRGIWQFGQAFRGYCDPPNYMDADGKRFDNLDVYHDTSYSKVWHAMFCGLQGNLKYPPYADSMHNIQHLIFNAELMADNYPENLQYRAILKELTGPNGEATPAEIALYLREPDTLRQPAPPLHLPDYFPPELRIGHMRSGDDGRESLLLLSASHWGKHHHYDSLNLYYWKQGRELLTDLGYLWDHPDGKKTKQTVAHNTVIIDQEDQRLLEREGEVEWHLTTPAVKAMSATSLAYEQANIYHRTAALVDHGDGNNYIFDVFWAQGGKVQDYIFHGPNLALETHHINLQTTTEKIYDFTNIRATTAENTFNTFKLQWAVDPKMTFSAWNLTMPGEQVFVAEGWGQRDSFNVDRGTVIPYIVRRGVGESPKIYTSIFEGHLPQSALVNGAKYLTTNCPNAVAVQVETRIGRDYIVAARNTESLQIQTPDAALNTTTRLAVISVQDNQVTCLAIEGNGDVALNGKTILATK